MHCPSGGLSLVSVPWHQCWMLSTRHYFNLLCCCLLKLGVCNCLCQNGFQKTVAASPLSLLIGRAQITCLHLSYKGSWESKFLPSTLKMCRIRRRELLQIECGKQVSILSSQSNGINRHMFRNFTT
uniref:Uncharacterized protein n=1 Tax=Rhinopithecus roxellana TaxID=61622 RepID=A0A2K6N7W6_RHIRO